MTRVNPSGRPDKPNKISERKNKVASKPLPVIESSKKNYRRNSELKLKEVFLLLGQATVVLPGLCVVGAYRLLANYCSAYVEVGAEIKSSIKVGFQSAVKFGQDLKDRTRAYLKPKPSISVENDKPVDAVKVVDKKGTDSSGRDSSNSGSENKPETKSKSNTQVGLKDKVKISVIQKPILRPDILEENDKELIRQLIYKLNEIIPKSPNYKAEKVVVLLESLLMGVPFNDYIGIFNASYKNHLEQEELLEVAKNELTGIIGACIRDNDLASKIVERISMPKLSLELEESVAPVLLKFPTRASSLAEEFKDLLGIHQFLGINSAEILSLEEINLREAFLRDLIDINPTPAKINLNSEYKNHTEFKIFKNSRKYGFALGRIDQILREGTVSSLKTFSIRKKLAQILAPSINENQDIIDFTSKVVDMANYGVGGAERLIDKVYENRHQSILGHAVEVKNICNLFNGLKENRDVKSFKIEASKSIRGCDVDAYAEVVDSIDQKRVFCIEIKSSPDYVNNNSEQTNRLLECLPEGGKLVYIIDNVTEKFVSYQKNYNEIAKLRNIVSNGKIEIWQSNGIDLTSKIRKVLDVRDVIAA